MNDICGLLSSHFLHLTVCETSLLFLLDKGITTIQIIIFLTLKMIVYMLENMQQIYGTFVFQICIASKKDLIGDVYSHLLCVMVAKSSKIQLFSLSQWFPNLGFVSFKACLSTLRINSLNRNILCCFKTIFYLHGHCYLYVSF